MSVERRMAARMTGTHGDRFGKAINRDQSRLLVHGLPLAVVVVASLSPLLPTIATAPWMPPFGFLALLAWRLVRPGVLPLWVGAPLGAFDDLFSGQPFGSAVLLWSLAMVTIEAIESRFPWRSFWQDWATAAALIAAYILLAAIIAGGFNPGHLSLIAPQLLLSALLFPIIARMIAFFDRIRLRRVRVIT